MSDFISDTSTQTTTVFSQGNSFTSKTNPNLRLSYTAGLYYPSTDNFRIYVNSTDAFTIDNGGVLYGNGSGFTNLTYNNITGKPTNFQCDYNSTLINKPTNFQCDYNSTLINKPTNFQCDYNSTLINKPTNFQSDYNSTIINKPDLTFYITSNFVLSNYISSNVLNSTLSIYDTIALRNTALGSYTTTSTLTTLLSAKEATLTFSAPLTRTTNTISLDLSSYDTIALRNTALSSYLTTATASSTYATITNLGTKENVLTFSSPLTRTTNTISLDLSSYDTIALRNTALASYLPLTGGTISGATIFSSNLTLSSTTPSINIKASSEADSSILYLSTPFNSTSALKCAIIAQGQTSFSRSKLHFCLDGNLNNTFPTYNASIASSKMSIDYNGLVSITNILNAATLQQGGVGVSTLITNAVSSYLPLVGGTITGNIIINAANSAFFFGGGGGASVSQASGAGAFSSSAAFGDCIVRSQPSNQLILQSGSGGGAIIINSGNNVTVTNTLNATTLQQGGVGVSTLITNALSSSYLPLSGGTMTASLIMTGSSSAFYFGSSSGCALGEAGGATAFSTASLTNDCVLRSRTGNSLILQSGGNAAGIIINSGNNTTITGALNVGGILTVVKDVWILSSDGILRIFFSNNGTTYFHSGSSGTPFIFRNFAQGDIFTIDNSGNVSSTGSMNCPTINVTTINNSGMNITDGSYINYPNYLYFKNTVANKTITFSSGHINAYDLNLVSNLNLLSTNSAITFYNKWFIFYGSANGVSNSLIFNHVDTGINSYWWLSGTQTATQSEISDERVKKQIEPISDGLNKLMKLKPKEYYLCDDKDYNKKFGVIAQDVEIDFPELIHTDTEYIANINSYATYDNFIITFDKVITDLINLDDELKIVLDNNDKNNLEIVLDDTPYNNRYKKRYCKVIEIIDDYSFKIDIELKEENVFVFGKKVNDFKKLDYQSLYCLNISATQELYKIIKELQARIEVLENKA